MSPSIWTRCAGKAEIRRLTGRAWRVVEAQHVVSTRKLVDSAEEQEILEGLIEGVKPPAPRDPEFSGLHFLLATPFRYPPLRHGSRFGTRAERSIWYGSTRRRTALAEASYYRLLFLEGTAADLAPLSVELSVFRVGVRTRRGVDLSRAPFHEHRSIIASPVRYDVTQRLGAEMRGDGVEAFRFPSARDATGGVNVALFTPRAFDSKNPDVPETWHSVATRQAVEFTKRDFFDRRTLVFDRSEFEVRGRLPTPAP